MIPAQYEVILQVIQSLGAGVITPTLLVYFIMKMRRTNEKLEEHASSFKKHTEAGEEIRKVNDNKFVQLITFMIRTNGKLHPKEKRELTNLLKI